MNPVMIKSIAVAALAVAAVGCTSWRYRGFVNEAKSAGNVKPERNYRIESVDFESFRLDVAAGDGKFTQWIANKIHTPYYYDFSEQEADKEMASFASDIATAARGYCSEALDAIPIKVRFAPHREVSSGTWSSLFPLFCSLGIVPSEKTCDVPFDVQVTFPGDGRSRTMSADLRVDSRAALSPFGSVRYEPTDGATACETIAGSWLFGERDEVLRRAFVKTVADAVKLAIAEHDGLATADRPAIVYEKDEDPVEFKSPVLAPPASASVEPAAEKPVDAKAASVDDFFENN